MNSALREIVDRLLLNEKISRASLDKIKIEVSKQYGLLKIPRNSDILNVLNEEEVDTLLPILRRKESRVLSGVSVVAVMTKPYPCPHGRCIYCPGGPDGETPSPQSYTGFEPAAMRGSQNDYDPLKQVSSRIKQLESIGHVVDKVDLIIMGGTFPASPHCYQEWFVKGCLDSLTGVTSNSLNESKLNAEVVGIRNVGITVETRPDCVKTRDVDSILDLGVTRVELGVQNVYNDIYKKIHRGHLVRDVIKATSVMKDSALKICYHMMPGLPGSSPERDLEGFKIIFDDPRFKPDMIKIYPTLVIKGTRLYDLWKSGAYDPINTEDAIELISRIKEITPLWVRIMRVQRDIPLPMIEAGVEKGNLRQLAKERLEARGGQCQCIRCREVGHGRKANPDNIKINHIIYKASGGIEDFISAVDSDSDALIGFIRLRIPYRPHRAEIDNNTGLIRELHIYGRMVPVGDRIDDAWQHLGWGETLINEAENSAKNEYDVKKMIVMSALGTKIYYSRLGYHKDGPYMSKLL